MQRLAVVTLVACHAHATSAPQRSPDPCDAIDAMLAIDNAGYQSIYADCATEAAQTRVIQVRAPASFLSPHARCDGHRFRLVRDQPDVQGMVVLLDVFQAGTRWAFQASSYQPNPTDNPDGSFDVTDSYCIAGNGFVEWTGERWRAFVEADAPAR